MLLNKCIFFMFGNSDFYNMTMGDAQGYILEPILFLYDIEKCAFFSILSFVWIILVNNLSNMDLINSELSKSVL